MPSSTERAVKRHIEASMTQVGSAFSISGAPSPGKKALMDTVIR